jgi:hypothetical protein
MKTAAEWLAEYKQKETQLWDRQPWDTYTAHARFRLYYLPQTRPRSISKAYRQWRKDEGEPVAAKKQAPRRWRYWAAGAKGPGPKMPGAMTWFERATDYDRYMALITQAAKEQWAVEVARADYEDGAALRDFARTILKQGPQFIKTKSKIIKGQTRTIEGKDGKLYKVQVTRDLEVITMAIDSQALIRSFDTASKLQRLAADVSDPVTRLALLGEDDDEGLPADMVIEALRRARGDFDETDDETGPN